MCMRILEIPREMGVITVAQIATSGTSNGMNGTVIAPKEFHNRVSPFVVIGENHADTPSLRRTTTPPLCPRKRNKKTRDSGDG